MSERLDELFSRLTEFDQSVAIKPAMLTKLKRRQIKAGSYSRHALFSAMATGAIRLFSDYPSLVTGRDTQASAMLVQSAIENLGSRKKYEVRCGASGTSKYLTGRELIRRWNNERAKVSVTDLHFRESKLEHVVDPQRISWFNLLPACDEDTSLQEMMTMVVSSQGVFSDSHSDAPDGSNHCFQGRKIWLMWDTLEGRKLGLQDCSRDDVYSQCDFDMTRFLQLRSSRWLSITEGQTLFLPGDYTHKVITLEKYLGVGSFYVSLPNCLRTLSRWITHGSVWNDNPGSWQDDGMVMDVARVARQRVRSLRSRSDKLQQRLGYDFLGHSVDAWIKANPERHLSGLKKVTYFNAYLDQLPTLTQS